MSRLSTYRDFPFDQGLQFVPAVIPLSSFPLSVTKLEYFKWIYRVRSWRFVFDLHNSYSDMGGSSDVHFLGSADFDKKPFTFTPLPHENFMACTVSIGGTVTVINGANYTDSVGSNIDYDLDVQFELCTPLSPWPPYAPEFSFMRHLILSDGDQATEEDIWDNNYLPSIYISMSVPGPGYGVSSGYKFGTDWPESVASFDTSHSIPIWGTGAGVSGGGAIATLSGSLSVAPLSWWPMDPGDGGGPVYNSATGAELRNPRLIRA